MADSTQSEALGVNVARILLIDDEEGVRSTARLILESAGHEVTEAEDGARGLALFQAGSFDLVITDLYMPRKEGIETIQDLVALGAKVPILAMSGAGGEDGGALVDAQLLGARATLSKPFTATELREAVDELLLSNCAQ